MQAVDAPELDTPDGHDHCPVCGVTPRVLVAIIHPAMRALTCELLEREFGCWVSAVLGHDQRLAEAIEHDRADLVIVDGDHFPSCCRAALRRFPPERVIVIGPEPDESYRAAALASGAGAWIPRDRVGDDLAAEMRRVMRCTHSPCPVDARIPPPSQPERLRLLADGRLSTPGGCQPTAVSRC